MTALAVGGAMHVSIAGGDETPDWAYTGVGDAFEVAPGGFLTLDRLALHGGVACLGRLGVSGVGSGSGLEMG